MGQNVSRVVGEHAVIASGTLVLGPEDASTAITIENLTFRIVFSEIKEGQAMLSWAIATPTTMELTVVGTIPLFGGIGWLVPGIGIFHGKSIYLALHMTAVGDLVQNQIRIISYTFTSRDG